MQLHPHQTNNIAKLLKSLPKYGASLDASDTGVGKTATSVGLCREVGARPAIICPLPCIPSWAETCAALGVSPLFIENYEGCKSSSFAHGKLTVTEKRSRVDPEKVTRTASYTFQNVPPRTIFIFDEVQRCRGARTQNSAMLQSAAKDFKTMMLSATPFTEPGEAFAIGRALRLFSHDGFFRWQLQHGVRKDNWGRWKFMGGPDDMEKIHHVIFPERGVRTHRSEIPGFPETLIIPRSVETGSVDAISAKYHEALAAAREQDYARAREGVPEDLHEFVHPLAVTNALRARQEIELLKVPVMAEMARDNVAKGVSVPIFLNFDYSIELMAELLGTDCLLRGQRPGGADNLKRAGNIRAFQSNASPYIIVNAAAGGAGVNLHDPINQRERHALISPPWSAVVFRQVVGRSHRLGGGYSTQEVVFAAGTIEDRVLRNLQARIDNLDALTDGDLDVLDPLFGV